LHFQNFQGIIAGLKIIATKDFTMARTTNSDTLKHMDSKYELGMLATQRVRDLNGGAEPVVAQNNDKPTVLALREIASEKLDISKLRHEFVQSYKSVPVADDTDASVESQAEDPLLKELDAELEDAIVDTPMEVEELGDELEESTPDAGEAGQE
jgi:DNA-directed RNA polymerase subunit omega